MLQVDSALFYFDKCYEINLKSGDVRSMTSNLLLIGSIYVSQDKYDLAMSSYKKAMLDLQDTSVYYFERSKVQSDMASAYQNLGHIDSAVYLISSAKTEALKLKSTNYLNRIDLKYIDILIEDDQLETLVLPLEPKLHV